MKDDLHEIETCEVCGGTELVSVLDLGLHPMCDDLVEIGDERICREYPIEILYCQTCQTAHQRYQVPKQDLFPTSYHYRSRFTADVLNGMKMLVESCESRFGGLSGKKVLDIGCNDGSLLDFFSQKGAQTVGIEPTGAYSDAEEKGHVVFNDYLTQEIAKQIVAEHGSPDFITFTNVFAHIEDLKGVVESLKTLIGAETVLVIENHYLGAVLAGNQFDTFYHEHPRTYSYSSFEYIARSLGANLIDVEFPSRYGGNIRVFMGNTEVKSDMHDKISFEVIEKEKGFFEDFANLRRNIEKWKLSKTTAITNLINEHGPILGKAFPGRAAILVKLLELDVNQISAVYEKPGSMKIGYYLPGTRIPIRSDEELFASPGQAKVILNMAWHISGEIKKYLKNNGITAQIIDILSQEDFQ